MALALVLAACGGSGDSPAQPDPDDLQAQVASFDLAVGPPSRFLVGVLSFDNRFLAFGSTQFRFSFLGTRDATVPTTPGPPVTARFLAIPGSRLPDPLPPEPRLVSGSEARGVYAAQAGFDRAGFWEVEVEATVGGERKRATAAFEVRDRHLVPVPGERALATENHTLSSPDDIPRAAIDSRAAAGAVPDPELHDTTVAAALAAGRPAVVVFATPVYCQSQFCGPITDMVADLATTYGDRAEFIHIEIWRDFQSQTINRAAADWILREGGLNEPWVFVIGADGVITHRFDNVATAGELEPILRALPAA
jgi:hypothetical protein